MLVNEFWKIPFLRFILPFIAGIILANNFDISLTLLYSLTLFFVGLCFVYRPFLNHETSYTNRWIFGAITTVAILFAGFSLTAYQSQYTSTILTGKNIIGDIVEPIKETEKSVKIELKVEEYEIDGVWHAEHPKILVYLEKDSIAKSLKYGDRLLLSGNLKSIANSGNPEEFDYKKYLSQKGIHFQAYQNSRQWLKLGSNNGNFLFSMAYGLREKAMSVYKKSGISGDEFAILTALTLGVKDYLSDEIVESYSDSGAMHVLAVSGLHVGIIMLVVSRLLSFMNKRRYLLVLQSIIIIVLIWIFAMITGLAPSVSRASLMVTFILVGKISRKKPSIYNTIAASAFIILLMNPQALFQVGFQLSYIAVISIILFQPKIYRLLDVKNYWLDKIWQLTSVSFAAQIGTSAISIYYFHKFPVYALFTNIIAIPAAFLIMCGAILLILSSFNIAFAKIVAFVLGSIIKIFNVSTGMIEHMPMAAIKDISLNGIELALIYGSLFLLLLYFKNRQQRVIYFAVFLIILSVGSRDYRYFTGKDERNFIVFNTPKKSVYALVSNNKMILFADSLFYSNKKSVDYLTGNLRTSTFISATNMENISTKDSSLVGSESFPVRFIQMDTLKIACVFDKLSRYSSDNKLIVDYVVLGNDAGLNIEAIRHLFTFEQLIIDSSVPVWKQNVLKRDCDDAHISYFNVADNGAFVWSKEPH